MRYYSRTAGRRMLRGACIAVLGLVVGNLFSTSVLGGFGFFSLLLVAIVVAFPRKFSGVDDRMKDVSADLQGSCFCRITGQVKLERDDGEDYVRVRKVLLRFEDPLVSFDELKARLGYPREPEEKETGRKWSTRKTPWHRQHRPGAAEVEPLRPDKIPMPTVTMDYTKHGKILLEIRDGDGEVLYRYSRYDPEGVIPSRGLWRSPTCQIEGEPDQSSTTLSTRGG